MRTVSSAGMGIGAFAGLFLESDWCSTRVLPLRGGWEERADEPKRGRVLVREGRAGAPCTGRCLRAGRLVGPWPWGLGGVSGSI